jgi:ankyrin repeat protein
LDSLPLEQTKRLILEAPARENALQIAAFQGREAMLNEMLDRFKNPADQLTVIDTSKDSDGRSLIESREFWKKNGKTWEPYQENLLSSLKERVNTLKNMVKFAQKPNSEFKSFILKYTTIRQMLDKPYLFEYVLKQPLTPEQYLLVILSYRPQ